MTSLLPLPFPTPTENAVASFSYFDFSEGRGYKIFYGFSEKKADSYLGTTSTEAYKLSDTADVFSNTILTSGSGVTTSPADERNLSLDLDFDYTFNQSQIVDGPMRLVGSYGIQQTTGQLSGSMHYNIYKVSSGTETLLASGGTFIGDIGSNLANSRKGTKTVVVDIPLTNFAPSDILRVNAQGWCSGEDTGAGNIGFAHDPQDRAGNGIDPANDTTDTSKFEVHVPFRIKD